MSKKVKTLVEVLNEQEAQELIYIGANDGSGWYMIETASEILAKIDDINMKLYEDAQRVLSKHQDVIRTAPLYIVETRNELASLPEISEDMTPEEKKKLAEERRKLDSKILAAENRFFNGIKGRAKYESLLRKWIPFKDRKVIDVYPHTYENTGVCIIVDSSIVGRYWTKKEYDADKAGVLKLNA